MFEIVMDLQNLLRLALDKFHHHHARTLARQRSVHARWGTDGVHSLCAMRRGSVVPRAPMCRLAFAVKIAFTFTSQRAGNEWKFAVRYPSPLNKHSDQDEIGRPW